MTSRTRDTGPLGDYELGPVVGQGSTSTVYRARRRAGRGGPLVALKRLRRSGDAAVVQRLRAEAAVLARLDHPNVVRVLEVVPDGTGAALAMEYAAGGSLAALLSRRGRLPPEEVLGVALPVADALAAAHRKGVVHGDVKPANILFGEAGAPVLADFGIAGPQPGTGTVMGTAGYVDPDVLKGARPDERSDVYGLGAVCHEMLCGRPPGLHASAMRAALGPSPLAGVVERALAPRPGDRFPDMTAMARALGEAAGRLSHPPVLPAAQRDGTASDGSSGPMAGPDPAGPPTRSFGSRPGRPIDSPTRSRPWPHRRPGLVAVVAGAALAAVGTSAIVLSVVVPGLLGTPERPGPNACPPVPTPMEADLDGDGCPSAVMWSERERVLEVEGRRYRLGQPGDTVLLGDWDCDGRDTPALYRPGGAVFFFDAWAEAGQPLPAASQGEQLQDGKAEVVHGEDGCDRLVVR